MKKYRVGIVGFGWVAGAHLKTFTELPSFEPVAIMSRRKLDPVQIKAQYGADVKISMTTTSSSPTTTLTSSTSARRIPSTRSRR